MLRDEAAERNKERALLGKVLASKVVKRGGLSKTRAGRYPNLGCLNLVTQPLSSSMIVSGNAHPSRER